MDHYKLEELVSSWSCEESAGKMCPAMNYLAETSPTGSEIRNGG